MPQDMDTDLEQLIKGNAPELSLAADRLGYNLFGLSSGAQVTQPPPPPAPPARHDYLLPRTLAALCVASQSLPMLPICIAKISSYATHLHCEEQSSMQQYELYRDAQDRGCSRKTRHALH